MSTPRQLPRTGRAMDESFFTAQRRHRRTARAFAALAAVAALLQALPAAVMLLPVTLGAAVLLADVVNLVTPTPDLATRIGEALGAASAGERAKGFSADSIATVSGEVVHTAPAELMAMGLLPGMLGMVALWWLGSRFLLRDGLGGVLISAGGRPPDRTDDEEHQLVNVVEEIALAAGIRPPRVLVLPAAVPNAAAFGRRPDEATIAVSRGLLEELDRDATQGVVAHLVASVANGDLRMRHSLLAVFLSYALATDLLISPFSSPARRRLRAAWRTLRGKAGPEQEASTIRDLLRWHDEDDNLLSQFYAMLWRLAQFWTNLLLVGGFLTLPLRARKYLADATAVQLARTPDGLGRALLHLHGRAKPLPGAEWAAIYTITSPAAVPGADDLEDAVTLPASLHPPMSRRLARLGRLGFREDPAADPWPQSFWRMERNDPSRRVNTWPWPARRLVDLLGILVVLFVIVPLVLLIAAIALGGLLIAVELGTAIYAFLALPVVAPLHLLLRYLA